MTAYGLEDLEAQVEGWESQAFERYGEPLGTFRVREIPEGPAPIDIKEQWLWVPMTVRRGLLEEHRFDPDSMPIAAEDAVSALVAAKRVEAAGYWIGASIFMLGYLNFRRNEGLYVPTGNSPQAA